MAFVPDNRKATLILNNVTFFNNTADISDRRNRVSVIFVKGVYSCSSSSTAHTHDVECFLFVFLLSLRVINMIYRVPLQYPIRKLILSKFLLFIRRMMYV
jgi:hypothetical protein